MAGRARAGRTGTLEKETYVFVVQNQWKEHFRRFLLPEWKRWLYLTSRFHSMNSIAPSGTDLAPSPEGG
jgi:hypothetical protein